MSNLERKDKVVVVGLVLVLVFIIINIFSTLHTMSDYEQRKESGNDRWKQVENRVLQTEEKMNRLEEELINGSIKSNRTTY